MLACVQKWVILAMGNTSRLVILSYVQELGILAMLVNVQWIGNSNTSTCT